MNKFDLQSSAASAELEAKTRETAAELRQDAPFLDLHGRNPDEIHTEVDQFLYRQIQAKEPNAKIIYGIGKGVLAKETKKFLSTHPLVEKVIDKGGYCIVLLET